MSDFSVRSDNVDVEQIMRQIRGRIREKRGADYTEEEIRELANVKLEKFLDPRSVRSDLLDQFRRSKADPGGPPNFAFEDSTLFESHRGPLRWLRNLLRPILKLFFNPNPLIQALHIQSELNTRNAELDALRYEVTHNLVLELTRTSIEVKNLKMRLESMASRLDFDERRARALEGVVQYRPGAAQPLPPPTGQGPAPGPRPGDLDADGNERRARRRRRRGRRRGPAYARDGSPTGGDTSPEPRRGEASPEPRRGEASAEPRRGEGGPGDSGPQKSQESARDAASDRGGPDTGPAAADDHSDS